jgi:hypothetical protein
MTGYPPVSGWVIIQTETNNGKDSPMIALLQMPSNAASEATSQAATEAVPEPQNYDKRLSDGLARMFEEVCV